MWHIQVSLLASLAVLPIMLLDILRLSHRWVGPLFRLRASLHQLSLGEPIQPIRFRDGDYWQDLARDVNVVTEELMRHRSNSREDGLGSELPLSKIEQVAGCGSQQAKELANSDTVCLFQGHAVGADASPAISVPTGWSTLPTSARGQ